ncbi:MAG TPA: ABC transporter permease [Vicinamibacteria bacterium]|nr:ABC transporter permease [Vicinamibacteria bacterium]
MDTLWQDVRFGLRNLARAPMLTAVVALTLALGIGANTTIFSVVNAFLFRPLPVQAADRLMVVAVVHEGNEVGHAMSYADYLDYQRSGVFSDMCGFALGFLGLGVRGQAERVVTSYVTSNFFTALGLRPALGRLIQPGEGEAPGTEAVLVLGHSYWKRRFGGDPSVVGSGVTVNGRAFTVIGVAPESFRGPYAGFDMNVYVPIGMASVWEYRDLFQKRDEHALHVLAHLAPGVAAGQAQAALDVIARRLEAQYPDTNKTVRVQVIPESLARPEPQPVNPYLVAGIFLGLVVLVLMLACVNVVNVQLVRASMRRRELAVRASLGASRGRLVRQLVTESVLLATLGGAAGLLLALWAMRALESIRLPDLPLQLEFAFDARVFAYAAALTLASGILVGLVPALRVSRGDLGTTLREAGRGMDAAAGGHRLRDLLVALQVAASVVLLAAAGLFLRSLHNVRHADLGFQPEGVLDVGMDVSQQGYDRTRGEAFFDELERRVEALPGVSSAAWAYSVPMGYYNLGAGVLVEGVVPPAGTRAPSAPYNAVAPDYFETLGIRIVDGRAFLRSDDAAAPRVAIVNETMAGRLWPGRTALGRRFRFNGPEGPLVEVIGIAQDGKYRQLVEDPQPYFYVPLRQDYHSLRVLHVRTRVSPESLTGAVTAEVRALDPNLPVFDLIPLYRALRGANGDFLPRMAVWFAGILADLGIFLAVIGVYGVVSYTAAQRTHEIGIRTALGAERRHILALILGHGLAIIAGGIAAGTLAGLAVLRLLRGLLVGVTPGDPATFVAAGTVLAAVALVASGLPAWRATRVDPMTALRCE